MIWWQSICQKNCLFYQLITNALINTIFLYFSLFLINISIFGPHPAFIISLLVPCWYTICRCLIQHSWASFDYPNFVTLVLVVRVKIGVETVGMFGCLAVRVIALLLHLVYRSLDDSIQWHQLITHWCKY